MVVLILIGVAFALAVVTRLAAIVRNDRPTSPPRSHAHELDPHSARQLGLI